MHQPGLVASHSISRNKATVFACVVGVAMGLLFGHRPDFSFKLPLVFCTFDHRIKRGQFMLIALAPVVLLNALFLVIYHTVPVLKLWALLALTVNSLGATGDLWIAWRLFPHARDTWVQDTKTGIEVWGGPESEYPGAA